MDYNAAEVEYMLTKKPFGDYTLYTIENENGLSVSVTELGATVQSIVVPDRNGVPADIVLGYDTPEEYLSNDGYFGATVGRYANRIAGASFLIGGKKYDLTANEGKNTLHGGAGFSFRRFEAKAEENAVTMSLCDPDGSDGFPGNMRFSVRFELTGKNEFVIDYSAKSDADTPINPTNHSYFNLRGSGDILGQRLMIDAERFLPVDGRLLPTGELAEVCGTPFDFRATRFVENGFYDHNFVLRGGNICAAMCDAQSGRRMTVRTDMPGLQLYTAGGLSPRRGKNGAVYGKNCALCLETQFFPDSPNRADFPSCVLKAGGVFHSKTVYEFSAY